MINLSYIKYGDTDWEVSSPELDTIAGSGRSKEEALKNFLEYVTEKYEDLECEARGLREMCNEINRCDINWIQEDYYP